MTERTRNIAVGLTAVAGAAGLVFLIVLFGYVPEWARGGYELRIEMERTGGLQPGARVLYQGIDIGSIKDVGFHGDGKEGVYAIALIESDHPLPANAEAEVISGQLLSGGASMELHLPEGEQPEGQLPTDGSAVIQGRPTSMLAQMLENLQAGLSGPIADLGRVADSFETLSAQWTKVGANIENLTAARSPEEVDNQGAEPTLATVIARTDQRLTELEEVLTGARSAFAGIDMWANDRKLREDVAATAANTRELTANLNEQVGELSRKYVEVADDLSVSIEEMRKTIELARTGDGTVGKLLNDPALYNNLNDAAERLNTVLGEVNHLLEKLKTEGLPIKLGEQ